MTSITSSPGSVSGPAPCAALDGPTTGRSGPAPAPASPSVWRAPVLALTTLDTSGRTGFGSSRSDALTRSLVSRLQARAHGSILFRLGYAFGKVDLPAAGFSGAHIRQRFYWAADAAGGYAGAEWQQRSGQYGQQQAHGMALRMADSDDAQRWTDLAGGHVLNRRAPGRFEGDGESGAGRDAGGLGHHHHAGPSFRPLAVDGRGAVRIEGPAFGAAGSLRGCDWLFCRDGKLRPVEPGSFPLAPTSPGRMGRLRAYGNAIDAEAATKFVSAYMDCY